MVRQLYKRSNFEMSAMQMLRHIFFIVPMQFIDNLELDLEGQKCVADYLIDQSCELHRFVAQGFMKEGAVNTGGALPNSLGTLQQGSKLQIITLTKKCEIPTLLTWSIC